MMRSLPLANPRLAGLEPYDAKNLPVEVFLSANENPADVEAALKDEIMRELARLSFNRYPDPLANGVRNAIAEANGLECGNVLIGNGGDEHLFNIFLAYGGPGRKVLNFPPTFSVYAYNAYLTGTTVVDIPRRPDFSIDEEAALERVSQGDIDIVIVPSPNNPTGDLASDDFLARLLDATDALVLVDEAYFEFSRHTIRPSMNEHANLLILRTFSKAFSLAGVRVGYLLGHEGVINEFLKVRQPYSVNSVSQTIARIVYENRARFEKGVSAIIENRAKLFEELCAISSIEAYPSDANYILFKVSNAHTVWNRLLEEYSVLVRDFSATRYLEDCLRVTVGTDAQNARFIEALRVIVEGGISCGK